MQCVLSSWEMSNPSWYPTLGHVPKHNPIQVEGTQPYKVIPGMMDIKMNQYRNP